jgi:hypothetical protein
MGWSAFPYSDRIRALLTSTPFGAVFPPRPLLPLPSEDARTHALRALRAYVVEVTFQLNMGRGAAPKPFQIEEKRFLLDWPDSPQQMLYPSIVVLPGPMEVYPPVELGGAMIDEDSADVHGPGTVLTQTHEHYERLTLQVHASARAMRRSIAAGLESVFSPTEERTGIVFRLPAYYDQTCRFTLARRSRSGVEGDADAARERRTEDIALDMDVSVVRLVRYAALAPRAELEVV